MNCTLPIPLRVVQDEDERPSPNSHQAMHSSLDRGNRVVRQEVVLEVKSRPVSSPGDLGIGMKPERDKPERQFWGR
jgi:hypothetical protein